MTASLPEALAHRRKVTKESPSLPNRAGKAYALRLRLIEQSKVFSKRRREQLQNEPPRRKYQREPRGTIRLSGVVRPKPDYEKLAYALLEHVRMVEARKRRENKN